jgi:hypothetical protein
MNAASINSAGIAKDRRKKSILPAKTHKAAKSKKISLDEAIDLTLAGLREGTAYAREIDMSNLKHGSHKSDNVVKFFGESFNAVRDGDTLIVKHPKWSLVGVGDTPEEAFLSLMTEAKEIAPFYVSEPDNALSPDAIALKRFLQKHFT